MTDNTQTKVPVWYWIITGILVLWGLMGLWVLYSFISATPESMAKPVADGKYSQAYADYYLNGSKAWQTAVFAIAVISGALGALCLVLRRAWALPLYALSLLMVIASLFGMFVIDKVHTMMSGDQIAIEGLVLLLGLLGMWFARTSKAKSWLK